MRVQAQMFSSQGPGEKQGDSYSFRAVVAVGAGSLLAGVAIGDKDMRLRRMQFPSGSFQGCGCDAPLTDSQRGLTDQLIEAVGSGHVKRNYTQKGSRLGQGTSLAYVSPGTMREAIRALELCVAADVAVIPQGANTSLTGGSIARNADCDRPTVVINMRRLKTIMPIGSDGGKVLCFGGAGIFDLRTKMADQFKRDSHTILGSLFLNPSVAAGVAYGSGGTQIRKGPAWTERALYARITQTGEVEVVNKLGLRDGGDILGFLENREALALEDIDPVCKSPTSWPNYSRDLRKIDASVARYNADTRGLESNRSEGKVMILATVHDTFVNPERVQWVWVSCQDFATAHALKREVALKAPDTMAKSCEYMNRPTCEGVDRGGRILIKMIDLVGMQRLEPLWNLKLMIESIPLPFTGIICDKFLYWFNGIIPRPLPPPIRELVQDYEHHVLMEFGEYSDGEVHRLREALDKFVDSRPHGTVKVHVCQGWEQERAMLFRFVVAPAFRTFCIGKGLQGLSIDYALPKIGTEYPPMPEKEYPLLSRWVYGHFGCNVYHEDLVYDTDIDVEAAKHVIKHSIEGTGGKLPAEHGHGTEYKAPTATQARWMKMDPLNIMNPGVGGTSSFKGYADKAQHLCS